MKYLNIIIPIRIAILICLYDMKISIVVSLDKTRLDKTRQD